MNELKITPYPYQAEGIEMGLKFKRFLNGDMPGLGKSFEAIATVALAKATPSLVICPSSLKINWQREVEKFTHLRALVLDDPVRTTWPYLLQMKMFDVVIVNYESLRKYFVWNAPKHCRLKDVTFSPFIDIFKSVIIDESHRVKDPSALQTKLAKGICTGKEYVILLSGTPVVNSPGDLSSQLSILSRLTDFGGAKGFALNYCQEDSDLKPLQDLLYEKCFFRREKKDVLKDLPAKTRFDIYMDISNRDEYDLAFNDLAKYLKEYKEATDSEIRRKMRMKALFQFMTLRNICSHGKVAGAIEYVKDFMESGQKLILFCYHRDIVDELMKAFPTAVRVTGSENNRMKQYAVDAFQNDPERKLIVCSIKAAGVGLNLTAASTVGFITLPWTYADCCQCEDRANRIGSKNNLSCLYFLGQGTIDERIYKLIQNKKSIAASIIGGKEDIPENESYFEELMNAIYETNTE